MTKLESTARSFVIDGYCVVPGVITAKETRNIADALRVVPGSHGLGRLDSETALRVRSARGERIVQVPAGGVMVMRPLLLHASSKNVIETPRRVLHFVFGPRQLPEGLRWAARQMAPVDRNEH